MKKMVLILILVIPVMIALVISLIAGFVGREIDIYQINSVRISQANQYRMTVRDFPPCDIKNPRQIFILYDGEEHDSYIIRGFRAGDSINLGRYITINPSRARFRDLSRGYSNTDGEPIPVANSPATLDNDGRLRARTQTNDSIVLTIFDGNNRPSLTFTIEIIGPQRP